MIESLGVPIQPRDQESSIRRFTELFLCIIKLPYVIYTSTVYINIHHNCGNSLAGLYFLHHLPTLFCVTSKLLGPIRSYICWWSRCLLFEGHHGGIQSRWLCPWRWPNSKRHGVQRTRQSIIKRRVRDKLSLMFYYFFHCKNKVVKEKKT